MISFSSPRHPGESKFLSLCLFFFIEHLHITSSSNYDSSIFHLHRYLEDDDMTGLGYNFGDYNISFHWKTNKQNELGLGRWRIDIYCKWLRPSATNEFIFLDWFLFAINEYFDLQ